MGSASPLALRRPPPSHPHYVSSSPAHLSLPIHLPLSCIAPRRILLSIARAESGDGELITTDGSPSPPVEKSEGKGLGFGNATVGKKKKGREKGAVIRRSPIQRPSSLSKSAVDGGSGASGKAPQEQPSVNENAFLLTWLGLGGLILVEGIALASSGFLPEQWDALFVKYIYPLFTPTVFLFVGGTVVYGVYKYLQGEQVKR